MNRDEYIASKKQEMDIWSATMDLLEAQIQKRKDQANAYYEDKLKALKAQRVEGLKKFDALKTSNDETWLALKNDAEKIWLSFREGITALQLNLK